MGKRPQPWDRQPGESDKAYEAFCVRLEIGASKGGNRAVAQKLGKSGAQIDKWSKRWHWPARVTAHIDFLMQQQANKPRPKLPDIMGMNELLARVSMLARADITLVRRDNGELMSAAELKRSGLGYLIHSIETTTTTYRSGTVRVKTRIRMESRLKALELLGRHMDLWNQEDPDLAAKRLLQAEMEARKQLAAGNGHVDGEALPKTD